MKLMHSFSKALADSNYSTNNTTVRTHNTKSISSHPFVVNINFVHALSTHNVYVTFSSWRQRQQRNVINVNIPGAHKFIVVSRLNAYATEFKLKFLSSDSFHLWYFASLSFFRVYVRRCWYHVFMHQMLFTLYVCKCGLCFFGIRLHIEFHLVFCLSMQYSTCTSEDLNW